MSDIQKEEEMIDKNRLFRQVRIYTENMGKRLNAGEDSARTALRGDSLNDSGLGEEALRLIKREVNRWAVLISDDSDKSFRRMLVNYMDLEEMLEEMAEDLKAEELREERYLELERLHPVSALWPEYLRSLERTEERLRMHSLITEIMNSRVVDCLAAARRKGEISLEDIG